MTNNTTTIPAGRKERLAWYKRLLKEYPGITCAVARRMVGNDRRKYMSKAGQVSQVLRGLRPSAPILAWTVLELKRRAVKKKRAA